MYGAHAKHNVIVIGRYFAINEKAKCQLHGMRGKVIKRFGKRTLVQLPVGKYNLPNKILAIF